MSTFAFKAAAIFSYLIIGSIIDSSIITFILVIMFSSLDFWVVKNVTGRLLVGLRWWSEIDKNGKETWRFENPDDSRNTNMVDSAFFWTSQVVGTAVWALLLVLKVLTLSVFWVPLYILRVCSFLFAYLYVEQISMLTISVEEVFIMIFRPSEEVRRYQENGCP